MAVRVRRDIWELGDEANPWRDPAIRAYADAISAMQRLNTSDPSNGANWSNQAAIHARRPGTAPVAGRLENQCQHASWYFLPWHRMYLYWFEGIIRSHMSAAVAETWALPYWNYSDVAARRALPPAFRQRTLPGGRPNPLFVVQRQQRPLNVNAGARLSAAAVSTSAALAPSRFTRSSVGAPPGFGGGRTGFHHGTSGGGAGPLEGTPHGDVHVEVGGRAGGFMSSFGTAALDPIFWLHHCNLDRLWERWRRAPSGGHPPGSNPTESAFLTRQFDFVRPDNTRVRTAVADVLDIEGKLEYTYSGLPAPPPTPGPQRAAAERPETVSAEHPPELVGATEQPVTLTGATNSARLPVSRPTGPARRSLEAGPAELPNVYLNLENIEGDVNPGLVYGVFVNLPEGAAADSESAHLAGTVSFFGIEDTAVDDDEDEEAPHELRYVYDITPIVEALKAQGGWDPDKVDVTFSPLAADDEELSDIEVPPVKIGRVSLFVE
jgi:tyrosinase